MLLDQAWREGLIGKTAPDRLTFEAMAVHALRVGKDNPCGLFVSLLHDEKLRLYLTDADDETARVRLNAHAYGIDPQRQAPPPPEASAPPALSEDARFVDLARRVLGQDGWRGDPFIAVKMQYPEWTRARWDTAVCELEQHQRIRKTNRLVSVEELGMEAWQASPFPEDLECVECGEDGPACVCQAVEDLADG
jgi:hypothetical protein